MGINKSKVPQNVRLLAVRTLHDISIDGAYANIALQQRLQQHKLSDQERRFFTELVYGVLRHQSYIDAVIRHFTKKPVKKQPAWIACILRLGIYQILFLDGVPERAAVDESVKLAKKLASGLSGLVNGVLRNVIREKNTLSVENLATSELERLALTYNQPTWLLELWLASYGAADTEALCAHFNTIPALEGRINTIKGEVEEIHEALTFMNVDWVADSHFPEGITIRSHEGLLQDTPWMRQGLIALMDIGSLAIAHLLDPQPGETILDVCAAPGSKTFHMAALMQNKGCIVAGDIHEHKVALLTEGVKRLGASIVKPILRDATITRPEEENRYDRILVDAPCSGLGILQKKLDMRWRKKESDLSVFPPLQLTILNESAKALRPGGVLVYSTCTLHRGENEEVVEAFLATHPDFTLEPISGKLPYDLSRGYVTLLPHMTHSDGFFMARLRKASK